jgi:simple sugar transport system permease protein
VSTFVDVLAAGLRFSTTINLAALGGLFTQKVGVWNVALEGLVLSSAFSSVWISYSTGSAWLGLAGGAATGTAVALLLAFVVVTLGADEIIAGLAINLLASGGTKFLLPIAFGGFQGAVVSENIVPLPRIDVPGLDSVPVVGEVLNHHSPLVYVGLVLVPVVTYAVYRTGFGLTLRAVGEAPDAAAAAGVRATRVRYAAFALSGILCGVAGSQLSLGFLALFSQDMTSGLGYIAFAAVVFGDAHPPLVFLGALVFGLAQAAVIQLGNSLTIPSEFISMVPYVVAIIALVVLSHRRRLRRLPPA